MRKDNSLQVENSSLRGKITDSVSENYFFNAVQIASSTGLALFVGSGLSRDAGIPTWNDLLIHIANSIDRKNLVIEEGKEPDIASELENICKQKGYDFYKIIRDRIANRKVPTQWIHSKIIEADFHTRLTTNFDDLFDIAAEDKLSNYNPQYWPNFKILNLEKDKVCYLHGNIFKSEIVFTRDNYQKAYSEPNVIKRVITAVAYEKSILFAGFSFKDVEFKTLYENIYQMARDEMWKNCGPHFILLSSSYEQAKLFGDQKYADFFRDNNIKPIYYIESLDSHINLHYILNYLIDLTSKTTYHER